MRHAPHVEGDTRALLPRFHPLVALEEEALAPTSGAHARLLQSEAHALCWKETLGALPGYHPLVA